MTRRGGTARLAAGAALTVTLLSMSPAVRAASPWNEMFPAPDTCYRRVYSAAHLDAHPQQRVTEMRIAAAPEMPAEPWPAVALAVETRGPGGGAAEAYAWCENIGGTLYCTMEGDAGAFSIATADGGAILVSVARSGISFETDTGFVTLEARRGDDRSFLLRPASGCR